MDLFIINSANLKNLAKKIIAKLIKTKNGVQNEATNVLSMWRLLRGKLILEFTGLERKSSLGRKNGKDAKEEASSVAKLKDTIHSKLKKIKRLQDEMFPCDSDDESGNSVKIESDSDDNASDSDEQGDGNLSASINSEDLDSIDSNSDSESFKDMIHSLNTQFKQRINKLIKWLVKKLEENNGEESQNDQDDVIEEKLSKKSFFKNSARRNFDIKEEIIDSFKKRDLKAKDKKEEDDELELVQEIKVMPNKIKALFKKQKTSSFVESYFYNKLRQGYSESSQSPKSSQSSIQIKQEEDSESQVSLI